MNLKNFISTPLLVILFLVSRPQESAANLIQFGRPIPSSFGSKLRLSYYENQIEGNSNYAVETWDWLPENDFGNAPVQIDEVQWLIDGSPNARTVSVFSFSRFEGKPTLTLVFELQTDASNVVKGFKFHYPPEFWIRGKHTKSKFFELFQKSGKEIGKWQNRAPYLATFGSREPIHGLTSPVLIRPLFSAKTHPDRYTKVLVSRLYQFEVKENEWQPKVVAKGDPELSHVSMRAVTVSDMDAGKEMPLLSQMNLFRREDPSEMILNSLPANSTRCFRWVKSLEGGVR